MKKLLTVSCFVLLLLLSLLLSACSDDEEAGSDSEQNITLTEPGTFPITEEKVTMRVLVPSNALVEDFETNEFTKWYEEKTNVHIEWEVIPSQNAEEKLNLVLSSGDLPDVIMSSPVTLAQLMLYGKQGMFIPLNDIIEEQGTVMNDWLDQYPEYKEAITAPDGNIYSLPAINECYHCTLAQKLWVYQPWLDELGLDIPETTEEFYEVLKAFKDQDPNGNGEQDEIPISGSKDLWPYPGYLMNAFIYSEMYLEDGKIQVPFNKPEWKEGLEFANRLHEEGLMAPEALSQDIDQLKRVGSSEETILGMAMGYWQGDFMQAGGNEGKWLDYVSIPPLKGPDGNQVAWYQPLVPSRGSYIVTNKAEHPEVAVRWAEGFYDEEVILRAIQGRPGEEWREAEDGELGIDGSPASWARITAYGQVQNLHWAQTGPLIRTNEFRFGEVATEEQPLEGILYRETKEKYEPYKLDDDKVVPPLYFNEEQSAELAELEATIETYVEEMNARFISGDADISTEWEEYLSTLDSMNLKRYIEIYQEAYDAKYN